MAADGRACLAGVTHLHRRGCDETERHGLWRAHPAARPHPRGTTLGHLVPGRLWAREHLWASRPAPSPCSRPHARLAPAVAGRGWWALTLRRPEVLPLGTLGARRRGRRPHPTVSALTSGITCGGFAFCCGCSHPTCRTRIFRDPACGQAGCPHLLFHGAAFPGSRQGGSREVPPRSPWPRGGGSPAGSERAHYSTKGRGTSNG